MRLFDAILYQFHIISLPWWMVTGAVAAVLFALRYKRDQIPGNIMVVYILLVLASTVLSRSPMTERCFSELINLDLLKTWSERSTGNFSQRAELYLNFCVLLPVGILFPLSSQKSLRKTVLFGMMLILLIEVIQLLTKRGWFEISDIVDNTFGVIVGYGLYWTGVQIWGRKKR